ncbi:glutathione S-transferase-like protein [Pterulicium gracile]|uniref:glutathione transferase n=1 Tax=Pterulicium gracile TaxID=1884261 RepID=A0A5C3QGT8_9AGAR|nr:glutathione S-transferase-like protein [Pterula gracilis]
MPITIYGSPLSPSTSLVELVLKELGVEYTSVTLNILTGENRTEKWKEVAPFGQVPWIDDDGLIIYEARAISRYLATKYKGQGTQLLPDTSTPEGLKTLAKFEQAASIEQSHFDPPAFAAIYEQIFKPMKKLTPDPAVTQEKLKVLDGKLAIYDFILGKQKYLAGEDVTLADLFHIPYGWQLDLAGFDSMSKHPNVARWWKDISSRQTWKDLNVGIIDLATL